MNYCFVLQSLLLVCTFVVRVFYIGYVYILALLASRFLRSNIRMSFKNWHNRPYVLEALWKLEGLRAEWHMELSAAGTN